MAPTNDYQEIIGAIQSSVKKAVSDSNIAASLSQPDLSTIESLTALGAPLEHSSVNLLQNGYFEAEGFGKINPVGWVVSGGYAISMDFREQAGEENAVYTPATTNGPPTIDVSDPLSGHAIKTTNRELKWYYVDDTNSAVSHTGTWTTSTGSTNSYNKTFHYSSLAYAAGTTITYTFKGTGIRFYGHKTNKGGRASVAIDGTVSTTADFYRSTTLYRQKMFEVTGLQYGTHTITLTQLNSKDSNSSDYRIYFDCFQVQSYSEVACTSSVVSVIRAEYNQNSGYYALPFADIQLDAPSDGTLFTMLQPSMTQTWTKSDDSEASYAGTWGTSTNASHYGGSERTTSTLGASATVSFSGTGIRVYSYKATDRGIAAILLDSTHQFDVNYYSDSEDHYRQLIFEMTGLFEGSHTLDIVCSGTATIGLDSYDVLSQDVSDEPVTIQQTLPKGVLSPGRLYQIGIRAGHYNAYVDPSKFIRAGSGAEPSVYLTLNSNYKTTDSNTWFLPIYSQDTVLPITTRIRLLFKDIQGSYITEYSTDNIPFPEGMGLDTHYFAFRAPALADSAEIILESDPPDDAVPYSLALDHIVLHPVTEGRQFIDGADIAAQYATDNQDSYEPEEDPDGLDNDGSVDPILVPGPPSFVTASGTYQDTIYPYSIPVLMDIDWGTPTYNASALMHYEVVISDEGETPQLLTKPLTYLSTQNELMVGQLNTNHNYLIQVCSVGFDGTKSDYINTGFYFSQSGISDITTVNLSSPSPQQLLASWTRLDRNDVISYTLAVQHSTSAYSSAAVPEWSPSGVTSAWTEHSVMQSASGINPAYYIPVSGDFWWRVAVKAVTTLGEYSTNWVYSTSAGVRPQPISLDGADIVVDIDLNEEFYEEIGDDRVQTMYGQGLVANNGGFYYYSDNADLTAAYNDPREAKITAFRGWIAGGGSSPKERAWSWSGLLRDFDMNPPSFGALRMGMWDGEPGLIVTDPVNGYRAALGAIDGFWGLYVENGRVMIGTALDTQGYRKVVLSSAGLAADYGAGVAFALTSGGFTIGSASGAVNLDSTGLLGLGPNNSSFSLTTAGVNIDCGSSRVVLNAAGIVGSYDDSYFLMDSAGVSYRASGSATGSGSIDMGIFDGYPQFKASVGSGKALLGGASVSGQHFYGLYVDSGQVYIKTGNDRVQITSGGISGSAGNGTTGSAFNLNSSGLAITTYGSGHTINLSSSGLAGGNSSGLFSINNSGVFLSAATSTGAGDTITLSTAGLVGSVGGTNRFSLTSAGLDLNRANINLSSGGYIQLSGAVAGNGMVITNDGIQITSGNPVLQIGYINNAVATGYGIYAPASVSGVVYIEDGTIRASSISGGSISGTSIYGSSAYTGYLSGSTIRAGSISGVSISGTSIYGSYIYGTSISGGSFRTQRDDEAAARIYDSRVTVTNNLRYVAFTDTSASFGEIYFQYRPTATGTFSSTIAMIQATPELDDGQGTVGPTLSLKANEIKMGAYTSTPWQGADYFGRGVNLEMKFSDIDIDGTNTYIRGTAYFDSSVYFTQSVVCQKYLYVKDSGGTEGAMRLYYDHGTQQLKCRLWSFSANDFSTYDTGVKVIFSY